jgi:hypothetical protein
MALEIQSSVNQMLSSAGILAGLYAHQPSVQKKREAKQKLKEIGAEKKQIEKERQALAEPLTGELGKFFEVSKDLEEDLGEEDETVQKFKDLAIELPSSKQLVKLAEREKTLSKQEEHFNPKLRIQRMVERSNEAKTLTLQALKEYHEGDIDLEEFKQQIGVKEPKNKEGGGK